MGPGTARCTGDHRTGDRRARRMGSRGDADAKAIFEEYNGSIMTAFPALSDDDIKSILAYTDAVPAVAIPKDVPAVQPVAEPANDLFLI